MSPRPERVSAARAIEALRAGVPNRDAVVELGANQPALEERFRESLQATAGQPSMQVPGILFGADFGNGKSHLLEHLKHIALRENFVVSKVVMSKETPLYDLGKLYRAAVEGMSVPGRSGGAMAELLLRLIEPRRRAFGEFDRLLQTEGDLNPRFAAMVWLATNTKEQEITARIVSDWSGNTIAVNALRKTLKEAGASRYFRIGKITAVQLALERFIFGPRMMRGAGYAGWVLLVDEIEMIHHYTFLQRARSYASLARLFGKLQAQRFPGLVTVGAITQDFSKVMLTDKGDRDKVPNKLRDSPKEDRVALAAEVECGINLIEYEMELLAPTTQGDLIATYGKVGSIHGRAYGWSPAMPGPSPGLASTRMREHIKAWINEWDLKRLYPGYHPQTVVQPIILEYPENPDFEIPSEESSGSDTNG